MGVGKLDATQIEPGTETSSELGLLLTLREGDVIVHPAGTGHSNISDEGNYRYLSFFPEVSSITPARVLWLSRPRDHQNGYLKTATNHWMSFKVCWNRSAWYQCHEIQ